MLGKEELRNQSIAVIGAGIIGLSIGLKLQQQGYHVTIFDPNGVGNGCSKGNAGHIATEQVFPLATPALIPQLPKMLLSSTSPVSIRWQDLPNTVKVRFGVFFPETGHTINPYALCVELSNAFEKLGGSLVHEEVDSVSKNGDVLVNTQRMSFDKIVVAAGVHSKALVRQLTGVNVPIQAERGYHLMMNDKRESLPFPISSADRKFIMTPMSEGLRLAGTVEYADVKSPPNMKRAEMLYQQGNAMFESGLNPLKQQEQWMGNRPSTIDSLPVIDQCFNGKILLAFGHQHLGLTQAAITADLISELVADKPTSVNIAPFTLQRFA